MFPTAVPSCLQHTLPYPLKVIWFKHQSDLCSCCQLPVPTPSTLGSWLHSRHIKHILHSESLQVWFLLPTTLLSQKLLVHQVLFRYYHMWKAVPRKQDHCLPRPLCPLEYIARCLMEAQNAGQYLTLSVISGRWPVLWHSKLGCGQWFQHPMWAHDLAPCWCAWGGWQMMVPVLGLLPPTWKTWKRHLAPGSGLAQAMLLQLFRELNSKCLSFYLCNSAFIWIKKREREKEAIHG